MSNKRKLIIDQLISFVLTENCPFLCEHCMRGCRRANNISEEVIDALLSQIIIEGTILLTGGEPLSQTKKAIYLIDKLYKLRNTPREMHIITNGSVSPEKFEELIYSLEGKSLFLRLLISNDYYHEKERLRLNNGNDNLLSVYEKYKYIISKYKVRNQLTIEQYNRFENGTGVSAIGRGANIEGARVRDRVFDFNKRVFRINDFIIGNVQVQPDGRITPSIDMSWEERDSHYGQEYNILNRSIKKIIKP